MASPNDLSRGEARRVALAAQGFDRSRPARVHSRHLRQMIRQLDLVPFSRLGPYDRSRLDDLVYRKREFTESWAHEASIVPVEAWPLLRHRRDAHRVWPYGFDAYMEKNAVYAQRVVNEVRARGPLTSADLPTPDDGQRQLPGSWYGTVPRAVLEAHFGRGVLAVADRRENFARAYDLAERVIAPAHYGRHVAREDAQRELVRMASRAHGVGTAADLADYFRMPVREAQPRIAELVEAGDLMAVRVEGWREVAYLHPDAKVPGQIAAHAILSPFDPVIWFRRRADRLFDFEYCFEIFVPEARRRWGCYVLPFLMGDRLVARVDLKADREGRRLLVQSAQLEEHAPAGLVAAELARELKTLAEWLAVRPKSSRSGSTPS
jgi:uncharacterized protein YcaQ